MVTNLFSHQPFPRPPLSYFGRNLRHNDHYRTRQAGLDLIPLPSNRSVVLTTFRIWLFSKISLSWMSVHTSGLSSNQVTAMADRGASVSSKDGAARPCMSGAARFYQIFMHALTALLQRH